MSERTMTMADHHAAYVQVLIDHIANRKEQWLKHSLDMPALFLQDYATIGIRTPRQSGATYSMMCEFINRESSMFVVTDPRILSMIRDNHTTGFNPISELPYPRLKPGQAERMLTTAAIQEMMTANIPPPAGKFTFLHDATQFFKKVRAGKFYHWLAEHVGDDHVIICLD